MGFEPTVPSRVHFEIYKAGLSSENGSTPLRNARVVTSDDLIATGTITVEPGSELEAHNLTIP